MFVVLLLRNNMGKCFADWPIQPGVHEFISDCLCYLCNIFFDYFVANPRSKLKTVCLKVFEAQRSICPGSREVIHAKTHATVNSGPPFVASVQEVCQSYRNAL